MVVREPALIRSWLGENLYKFDGPGQYLGDEPGSVHRPWDGTAVRWLLAASWPYMQASGNTSIPAVYRAITDADTAYLCERFYLPATPRDMSLLEKAGIPVFGIESKHPAADFDVFGTSISYTVLFMNFCKYLQMSGIPLRRRDRAASGAGAWPMVIIGGHAACAPEFMSAVADCFWVGDAEDEPGNPGVAALCARIAGFKASHAWEERRLDCYDLLAREFEFLYFPRTVEFTYRYEDRGLPQPVKVVSGYRARIGGLRLPVRSRKIADLDQVSLLDEPPLLYTGWGMGGGDLEVAKGCPKWCSFCRASWVTKPYVEESVDRSIERARQLRLNTGAPGLFPFALDIPFYSAKKELFAGLLEQVSGEVDASSFRVDDYLNDPDFALLLSVSGQTGITLGIEGNSQRMRDLAGKGISDADILEAVRRAIRSGITRIKLYMISNWPGEEEGDTQRIVELGREIAAIRAELGRPGVRVLFSWTPLLLEGQTPMQWFAVTSPDYALQECMHQLKAMDIDVHIGSKAHPEKLVLFQLCQRASRVAGEAIVDVFEGLGTASWGGFAKDMRERLDAALYRHGFHNGVLDLFGERYQHDLLGWEHISTRVSRSLMWETYRRMLDFAVHTSAADYDAQFDEHYRGSEWVAGCDERCSGTKCGACNRRDLELRQRYIGRKDRDLAARPVQRLDQLTTAARLRVKVTKPEEYRFVAAEALADIIRRAAYRACDQTGFPAIVPRSVRLASDGQRFRDRSAGVDYAEFGITSTVTYSQFGEFLFAMDGHLQPWLQWHQDGNAQILPANAAMPKNPPSLWELEVSDMPSSVLSRLFEWDETVAVPVLIRAESLYSGVTTEPGDAKQHVRDFWLTRRGHRYLLRMVLAGQLGPYQAYAALMGKASWVPAARYTATRLAFFDNYGLPSLGLLRETCAGCGLTIPQGLLGEPFDSERCPRCRDEAAGQLVRYLPAGV